METELTSSEKKLHILERMRRDIANKIDESYLQNNISNLLALEKKYEVIIDRISRARVRMSIRNRASTSFKLDSGV